ncbi:hypothetical protein BaRGS_00021439 [Batillaria attramentaria]|uniref:Uncharacterized protein n=1 Tax=Batillaria attramentaria TaxID=370345 RepID=A0ABD0KJH7_9CAEN
MVTVVTEDSGKGRQTELVDACPSQDTTNSSPGEAISRPQQTRVCLLFWDGHMRSQALADLSPLEANTRQ